MWKDIVILTKSSKNHGYCVAGIDVNTGKWIRLISNDQDSHGALFYKDIIYSDGRECNIFDVVRVDVCKYRELLPQTENFLINKNNKFQKLGNMDINQVLKIHSEEKHSFIFGNLREYLIDCEIEKLKIDHSLMIIKVENLLIEQIISDYNGIQRTKTKATFFYNSSLYEKFSVTDPYFYEVKDGFATDEAILVISLPDMPWCGRYYKFIAKIFY